MKVVAPIRSYEQVSPLLDSGADEFYCGVMFDKWLDKYGILIEYNRRGSFNIQANFHSQDELRKTVEKVLKSGKEIYLTANAIRICEEQISVLAELFRKVKEYGVSGVIISDPILVPICLELNLKFIISSCSHVINAECVRLYKNLGASRIIYPRSIHIDDMRLISDKISGIEFEAFLMNSACKFVDGNCLGTHNTACGSLCSYIDQSSQMFYKFSNEEIDSVMMRKLLNNSFFYKQLFSKEKGIGCAQCNIFSLMSLVSSLKIVGRLLHVDDLCKQIVLTKKNIEIAHRCVSEEEYRRKMVSPRDMGFVDFCNTKMSCYYR